jgi:phage gpG-like protein
VEFVFESFGEKLIARKIDRLGYRALTAKPAFEGIADRIRGYEKRLFDSEGASSGRPWEPLAASTVAHKAKAGLDPRILHATHRLRKSLTDAHDPEHLEIATNDSLVFGSLVPYGKYHARGSGHLPKRRPIQFNEAQKRRILKRLQLYLMTGEV